MAGHSKWANIRHRKGRQDAARQKIWTKILKEITVGARLGGGDLDANPRLRLAVLKARSNSVTKNNIDSAIAKGVGGTSSDNMVELVYEGYGPGGTAFIVTTLTDNKTRTVAEVRNVFAKNSGNMGETGSVSWGFHRKGQIIIDKTLIAEDELFDIIIEAGGDDLNSEGDEFEIVCSPESFDTLTKALESKKIEMMNAEVTYIPETEVECDLATSKIILKMLEKFEDCDDVQDVYHNGQLHEDVYE